MTKRLEGRGETIIDPDLPIVDAHHHLFDHSDLTYLLDGYREDAQAGHKVLASVYIETQAFARQSGPEILRPIGEIEFANGVGAMSDSGRYGALRACAGIVGYADLRHGDAIAGLLDLALQVAPDRFKGIRQITIEADAEASRYMTHAPPSGILQSSGFRPGFRHLASRGLSFDAAVFHHQLGDIAELADAFPDTTIILNHLGIPMAMGADAETRATVFPQWRSALSKIAKRSNIVCKIGGLGMVFTGIGFESRTDPLGYAELAAAWAPYVETAIEVFGTGRCLMESNFPIDGRSCGYVPLWNAMKHITRHYSTSERAALFHENAMRTYRIQLPTDH